MSAEDPDSDCEIEDDNYNDYYCSIEDEVDIGDCKKDPEMFQFSCLKVEEVEKLLNELVEQLSTQINVSKKHHDL
jgi:ariadne-2